MKTFVMGDIHGAYKAMLQCLKLSKFDKSKDRLICLGDVCDRGPQVKECIDELLTIPHCVFVLGNHDEFSLEWAVSGKIPEDWLDQGGVLTIKSYEGAGMPREHIEFLSQAPFYFVDENRLFVHGGFDPDRPLAETPKDTFIWDRTLIRKAREVFMISPDYKFGDYDEVYLGHTPTINYGKSEPQKFCNVWAMDTGAGHGAKLTMMDIETKQFWQAKV